jgi:hypothetical protein
VDWFENVLDRRRAIDEAARRIAREAIMNGKPDWTETLASGEALNRISKYHIIPLSHPVH